MMLFRDLLDLRTPIFFHLKLPYLFLVLAKTFFMKVLLDKG